MALFRGICRKLQNRVPLFYSKIAVYGRLGQGDKTLKSAMTPICDRSLFPPRNRLHVRQFVALAPPTGQELVGLLIADELFRLRIPTDSATILLSDTG